MPKLAGFEGLTLTEGTRRWVGKVLKEYQFDPGETELLRRCAELRDQGEAAQRQIATDGAYFTNRFGEPKQHPAIRVYQQSVDLLARLLKQLGVKTDPNATDEEKPNPFRAAGFH